MLMGRVIATHGVTMACPESFERRYLEAVGRNPEMITLKYGRPMDFGIRRPLGTPGVFRSRLSDEQVISLIGREESAIMNFTSMMIEGIAIQEISEWIERCKQRKLKHYRPYTRRMQQAMCGYLESVELYWQDRMDVYSHFFSQTLQEFQRELKVYLHLGMDNEICRQLPATVDREAALQLCFTIEMLRKSEEVDRDKMRMLSEAAGARIVRDGDPNVNMMIMACRDMQKDLGLAVEVTKPIREVIDTFRNRMQTYCMRLLDEEREEREAQENQ